MRQAVRFGFHHLEVQLYRFLEQRFGLPDIFLGPCMPSQCSGARSGGCIRGGACPPLQKQGRWPEAEVLLGKARDLYTNGGNTENPRVTNVNRLLGEPYLSQGRTRNPALAPRRKSVFGRKFLIRCGERIHLYLRVL